MRTTVFKFLTITAQTCKMYCPHWLRKENKNICFTSVCQCQGHSNIQNQFPLNSMSLSHRKAYIRHALIDNSTRYLLSLGRMLIAVIKKYLILLRVSRSQVKAYASAVCWICIWSRSCSCRMVFSWSSGLIITQHQ